MKETIKHIGFRGSSLDGLRTFPEDVRREVGHQLDKAQRGLNPDNWKPISSAGKGVKEIRVRDTSGAFRVMCVTKIQDTIYVLHCFQKKSQKTSKADLDLTVKRYKELIKEHSNE